MKRPPMHGADFIIKTYLSPNVNSTKAEKPRFKNISLLPKNDTLVCHVEPQHRTRDTRSSLGSRDMDVTRQSKLHKGISLRDLL